MKDPPGRRPFLRGHSGLAGTLMLVTACATGPGRAGPPEPEREPAPAAAPERPARPDYDRPLPAGARSLVEVDEAAWPELAAAIGADRASLIEALDRSLYWFSQPSSHDFYPVAGITHERARTSVFALRDLVMRRQDPAVLATEVRRHFELHSSVGWDRRGTVLFTGYYAPIFRASRVRTDEYRHPLYRRPPDLVTEPVTGEVRGRRVGDRIVRYPSRAEIESSDMLAGYELVWLRDLFDVYLIQLQGSASLRLRDGSTMQIGYAGNNGHEYVSVARQLVADGKLGADELSGDEVRAYFEANPHELRPYLWRNPRYVFFREVDDSEWPTGSLGVRVTPLRSLATDKKVFPPGAPVLVDTEAPSPAEGTRRLLQIMLDQDSGGGIRAAGRADIYFGVGPGAGELAARQYHQGRLYYLLLRPEQQARWLARMREPP